MSPASGTIAMITDFGLRDGYVGAMKGVILGINPGARLVDISHQIARHDVRHAALVLRHVCGYFPAGTVHLVVVDPGVGGERRPLVVETEQFYFVGPDNGVFAPVLEDRPPRRVVAIENRKYLLPSISNTFHGRDVFAPVAAHCSLGVPVERFGPRVDAYHTLEIPQPRELDRELEGHIIAVDRFGNLVTNISQARLREYAGDQPVIVDLGEASISGVSRSYQDAAPGRPVAIFNSWDLLEIAINGDSAQCRLGLEVDDAVVVRRRSRV
jgi:S-adenosylmethionine hydrolase